MKLGRALHGGEVLALDGELGSGKTALLRGVAAGLGIPPAAVSSPTFVLLHEYRGRKRLAHADLYRLGGTTGFEDLGLADYFDGETVVAIEWAGYAAGELPPDRLDIRLSHVGPSTRTITMQPRGIRSRACLARAFPLTRRHGATRAGARTKDRP